MDSGISTQAMIAWVNTLASQITNGQITIALSGDALDPASVAVGSGYYRSSDTTVIFSSENNQGLKSLQPGDTGQGTFTFATKKGPSMDALRNPSITMRISVAGRRNGEANVPQTIASSVTRTVKIATNLGLASKVVYTSGPFKNTGPWPPVPNKETTYTISYALTNTVNSVAGAQVTATLPSYVRFTGTVYPTDGSITYNESSRTVSWSAGDIPAGQVTPKTASFQVAITPSVSQSNSSPVLVSTQQVTGTDRFTQRQITGSVHELTTQTNSDPAYNPQNGSVK